MNRTLKEDLKEIVNYKQEKFNLFKSVKKRKRSL